MRSIEPTRRLMANRPLAALVGAGAVSGAGDWLYLTALPVLVYQRTGEPALVGLAAAGRLLPFLLLSLPAGIVADRFSPRSILVSTELIRCVAMLLIAWLCTMGADICGTIGLTLVAAAAGTFSMPALGVLVPDLAADDEQLGQANAIRATLDSLAGVIGPAFACVLIVVGGLPIAFGLNGLSFAAVALALLVCRPAARPAGSSAGIMAPGPDRAPGPGWTTIARRIAGPLALDGAISFASAAIGILAVLIAVDWLDTDASFTGLLNAGAGLGGIAGGLVAGTLINRADRRGVLVGVVAFVGATLVLGATAVPLFAVAAMGVAVGALILLDTLNMTTIQRLTSDGGTGRAIGLLHTGAAIWMMAGVLVPTLCMTTLGVQAAILVPAIVMLGLGAVSLLAGTQPRVGTADIMSPLPAVA